MEILGIPAGPLVGKAYKHLLEVRMDHGPLGPDEAEAHLRAWWAEQQQTDDRRGDVDVLRATALLNICQ